MELRSILSPCLIFPSFFFLIPLFYLANERILLLLSDGVADRSGLLAQIAAFLPSSFFLPVVDDSVSSDERGESYRPISSPLSFFCGENSTRGL